MTRVLRNEEIDRVLTVELALEALEETYRALGTGRAISGPRIDTLAPVDVPAEGQAYYGLKSMGGILPDEGVAALRLNSDVINWPVRDGNRRREKIPVAPGNRWVGMVLLFSTTTGVPLLICPDGYIQRMRVGAANGLGAKYMAREDARTMALLGTGWQAGGQLMAICSVRSMEGVRVYSPNPGNRQRFVAQFEGRVDAELLAVDSAEEAVRDADIIAAATNSLDPIHREEWVHPGVHLSTIKVQEVDESVLNRCDRIGMHTTTNVKQQTFSLQKEDSYLPEVSKGWWAEPDSAIIESAVNLADLAAGNAVGRKAPDEATCFVNNVGLGLQFAAVGKRVLEEAEKAGLGEELPTDWFTQDVHP